MAGFAWKTIAGLRFPRAEPWAAPLRDGRILVARGTAAVYEPAYAVQSVQAAEVYDPQRGSWSSADELLDAEGNLIAVEALRWDGSQWAVVTRFEPPVAPGNLVLPNGNVISAGRAEWTGGKPFGARETSVATVEIGAGPGPRENLLLRHPRIQPVLTLLRNGLILVTGGYETLLDYSWETNHRSLAQSEILDLKERVVLEGGDLCQARHKHTAILLPNDSVMVIGGKQDEGEELAHVELGVPI
jgi:hypothetical protein